MIRPIVLADAAAFAALVRAVFATLAVDPPPSAARLTAEDVAAHLAGGGGGLVHGAPDAGLLWVEREGGLYISRVAVAPAYRGRGLATRLIGAAEAEAVRRGLPRLWLSTRLALTGNRRLFARLGFVETALHAHAGFGSPTFVDMEKPVVRELTAAARA